VIVARTPVHISTPLPEDVLKSIVAYVEDKFDRHEKAISYKLSEDEKKVDTLIITLLDVAAELFSARQEIKMKKQSDAETLKAMDLLTKQLDKQLNDIAQ
jgi:pyruvate/2-oxoglutarate dehydrogenase complex dihydrolipoamide acyltransferase (E2) component